MKNAAAPHIPGCSNYQGDSCALASTRRYLRIVESDSYRFQFKAALRRLFTLRENKLLFHFVPRSFELETVSECFLFVSSDYTSGN
jgi:hypothetical protein